MFPSGTRRRRRVCFPRQHSGPVAGHRSRSPAPRIPLQHRSRGSLRMLGIVPRRFIKRSFALSFRSPVLREQPLFRFLPRPSSVSFGGKERREREREREGVAGKDHDRGVFFEGIAGDWGLSLSQLSALASRVFRAAAEPTLHTIPTKNFPRILSSVRREK